MNEAGGSRKKRRGGRRPRIWMLLFGIAVGFLFAEAVVRIGGFDWRYIRKIAFYQDVDLPSHEAVADPNIRFRFKPGTAVDYGRYKVTINSLGFRSPERPAAKPAGVYRILCVGGSNVYGANLNDDETWPAQLEKKLNALPGGGCYEVWNLGVSAQGGRQHAALAAEAIERIHPDLVIVSPSNSGIMPFLKGGPVETYFERDPLLWRNIVVGAELPLPPLLSVDAKAWLARHVRLYRLALLAWVDKKVAKPTEVGGGQYEDQNVKAVRKLLIDYRRQTRFAFFLCPHQFCQEPDGDHKRRYTSATNAPVLSLEAADKPPEYREIHPPAYVMTWYADNIADWLRQQGLAPACAGPAVLAPAAAVR
jgi:hypothetical protein